jgi:hypothetical protein
MSNSGAKRLNKHSIKNTHHHSTFYFIQMIMCSYLFASSCCYTTCPFTLTHSVPQCLKILLGKIFWIFCYKSTRIPNGQIFPQLLCSLTGDLASFALGKDFCPQLRLYWKPVMIDFKFSSVKWACLFILLLFIREKTMFKSVSTAKHH